MSSNPSDARQGWYCAHCQRGVDPIEVTYDETHIVCGRFITDDEPPAPPSSDAVARALEAVRIAFPEYPITEPVVRAAISAMPADEKLREALRPFAELADETEATAARHGIPADSFWTGVELEHLLNARKALGEKP